MQFAQFKLGIKVLFLKDIGEGRGDMALYLPSGPFAGDIGPILEIKPARPKNQASVVVEVQARDFDKLHADKAGNLRVRVYSENFQHLQEFVPVVLK